MRDFAHYLGSLLKAMGNAFTICSLLLLVATFFIPKLGNFQDRIQTGLLVIAFLFAGFYAWRRDRRKVDSNPRLEVTASPPELQVSTFHGASMGKATMTFDVDVCNTTSEMCILELPKLHDVQIDGRLFKADGNPARIRCKERPGERITFPVRVPAEDRCLFTVQVDLDVQLKDPSEIASELRDMERFSLDLVLPFRFLTTSGEEKMHLEGTCDRLRESVISHWKGNKQYEYVCLASGVDI